MEKNIVLCITGGIACYKAVNLASLLKKNGYSVHVVMTKNALKFINPITFKTITKNKVTVEMFDESDFIPHISLADLADIVVIAPATANIIAKVANGIADDMVSTLLLSVTCKKLVVPAMNTNMYYNPITQENIEKLKKYNYKFVNPSFGDMACGTKGDGRFPESETILTEIEKNLYEKKSYFQNKNILITLGGTVEDIDPVRCITNRSSGKMGFAFSSEFYKRGSNIKIIAGNVNELSLYNFRKKHPDIEIINIRSAKEMKEKIDENKDWFNVLFMCSAVADYKPDYSKIKIKKSDNDFTLKLSKTTDILSGLSKDKNKIYIGFAAESNDLINNAKEKLLKKQLDFVIANQIIGEKSAIGGDNAGVYLLNKINNKIDEFTYTNKKEISSQVLDQIEKITSNGIN